MNRAPQHPAIHAVRLLAILPVGVVMPAAVDGYDHKGTLVVGGSWNNPTGASGDWVTGNGTWRRG